MATGGDDGTQRYARVSDIVKEPLEMHMPIRGYDERPLVSLEVAVRPLIFILPEVQDYVYVAKQRCKPEPADGLTKDESASIILYSMEWEPHEECLYFVLNSSLRAEDRQQLKPWFLYLKLILTALSRLPSTRKFVYRGVKMDLSKQYPKGNIFVWWGFSSCTASIDVLENEQFLGTTGSRTLFTIDCDSGKDISRHSYYQSEKEILLLAARQFEVVACFRAATGLHMIQLKETPSPVTLLQPVNIDSSLSKPTAGSSTLKSTIHHNTTWVHNGITVAGGNGEGNVFNQLDRPVGIYVDEDKTIYVADSRNHRIVEWKYGATSGQVVAGGNGQRNKMNQLDWPIDVIVDSEGNHFIVCDLNNRRVVRWPRQNGTSGETIISNIDCSRLTMDIDGYLYVSNEKKHEVRRWKMNDTVGSLIAGGNGRGNGLNQLNLPTYIFVDEDHSVYVSDCLNHRVMKWMEGAKEGIVVAGGQSQGNRLTQLSYPSELVVDHLGTVYVADRGNHRIMRWPKGATRGSIVVGGNGQGKQANQLNCPFGLSFDEEGNLYTVDIENARVQRFNIDQS